MISTLSALIAQVESANRPDAIRFEPDHHPALQFVSRMMDIAHCSELTARVLCACSWGLYQIMGDELMSLGLTISPVAYCDNIPLQVTMFQGALAEKGLSSYTLDDVINDATKRVTFVRLYNGPGNITAYAQRLLDEYHNAS